MTVPSLLATLATGEAERDLRLLLFSLALWNPKPPKVYLACDTAIAKAASSFGYPGNIITRPCLDGYAGKTRQQMEQLPGTTYGNLWFDFMAEKISLMEWVFKAEQKQAERDGVFFCDADICFLAPLPHVPAGALAALSPHEIRKGDEARYGRYNGGYLWVSDPKVLEVWRDLCTKSTFYEQKALEGVGAAIYAADPAGALYEFPRTNNYGWWRMWQGTAHPSELQREWTMNRNKAAGGSGILVNGEPLISVHTHFWERRDQATAVYNDWVVGWLRRISGGHPPARRLLNYLEKHGVHVSAPEAPKGGI